jgi:hypothetical protein
MLASTSLGLIATKSTVAQPPPPEDYEKPSPSVRTADVEMSAGYGRAVAEDYQVLPSGQELSTQLRFITADASLGAAPVKFSDVALFDLGFNAAVGKKLAINASIVALPKQPSFTDELVWQGASIGLRGQIAKRYALGVQGSGGPLLGVDGLWTNTSVFVQHKRRLSEVTAFDLSGGVDGSLLSPSRGKGGMLAEVSGHASVLVNVPNGVWGGWVGVGYAVPVYSHGNTIDSMAMSADPNAGAASMKLDPQPRLDFTIGSGVRIGDNWDMFAAFTIVDRGDISRAQTLLPMLDGGFDQKQFILGLSRRLDLKFGGKHKRAVSAPLQML